MARMEKIEHRELCKITNLQEDSMIWLLPYTKKNVLPNFFVSLSLQHMCASRALCVCTSCVGAIDHCGGGF
jgi:hypothetical protein